MKQEFESKKFIWEEISGSLSQKIEKGYREEKETTLECI